MLRRYWLACPIAIALGGNQLSTAQVPSTPTLTPAELFEKVSPCVVKIVAKDDDGRSIGTGSGFAISWMPGSDLVHSRRIVTSYHVIRSAVIASIDPPFNDARLQSIASEEKRASVSDVVAEDKRSDLAVLAGFGFVDPHLELAEDTIPSIGTRVFVISSPDGLKNTLSEGLVSGLRERENGETWIQITAPVGPGSSGGPVLTADGKVIGVVVASHEEGQNLNFAVPARALRRLLDGKAQPRPVWRTVSIREEEDDAFSSARVELEIQTCGGLGPESVEERIMKLLGDECRAKIEARAESGDQWALIVRAREEYRRKSPEDCVALATLKRAIQAKSSEHEYLAYYYLGKLTSMTQICGPCVLQKKSWNFPEQHEKCDRPAMALLKKSTELNPKFSPAFARLAKVNFEIEQYPESLVAAEFLVALVPNSWEVYLLRGKAFAHLKRISAADNDFATAAALRPGCFDLYDQMFKTYSDEDIREYQKAFDASAKALSLPLPTDEEELKRRQTERFLLWYNTGNQYERLGDFGNALHAFEEANRLMPDRAHPFPPDIEERIARCRAGRP